MNPYLKFVEEIAAGIESARGLQVVGSREPLESDRKVLLFSPHPDDECITGLLPLRLMREAGMQIINVPVTFGSNTQRRAGRAAELAAACAYLGWSVHPRPSRENMAVAEVVALLTAIRPEVLFVPHDRDWNSRHIATHVLVMEALAAMPKTFSCTVVETEFWGAMDNPNLMVEGDAQLVADLVAATSLHVGEVARNPYHLLLPAWMQDNVRRGGELVGGQGGTAPDYLFATLYRRRRWEAGGVVDLIEGRKTVPLGADAVKEMF